YDGFDIVAPAVRWCQLAITRAHPHFRFRHADLHNSAYNPGGCGRPRDFTFPYEREAFDFVFLASVFTHILPNAVNRYLGEVARVLRPGGRCLATFFLLNEQSLAQMAGPTSRFHFVHEGDGFHTTNRRQPEAAVAYNEDDVRTWLAQAGLRIAGPI